MSPAFFKKKNQINLYKVQINLNEFNVRDTEKPPFNKIKCVALPSFCSPSQSSLAFLINSLRFEASSFKESICFWKQKQKIIMNRRFGPPLWLILSFRCRDKSVYCPYQNLFLAIFNVTRPRLPLKLPELVQEECSLPWFPTSVLTPLSLGQTWFAGSLGLNTTQQRIKNRALCNNVSYPGDWDYNKNSNEPIRNRNKCMHVKRGKTHNLVAWQKHLREVRKRREEREGMTVTSFTNCTSNFINQKVLE